MVQVLVDRLRLNEPSDERAVRLAVEEIRGDIAEMEEPFGMDDRLRELGQKLKKTFGCAE